MEDEGENMDLEDKTWLVEQIGYNPVKEAFYESIFSLANGYMGMRGFDEEKEDASGYEHCTFIAGIFDFFKPGITDMVNVPNFGGFKVSANGSSFSFDNSKLPYYVRSLNMKRGTLSKSLIWEDEKGNKTRIESIRFLSISDKHIACIKYKITPLNHEGKIILETGIDGRVSNNPVNDDQVKNDINPVVFLENYKMGEEGDIGYLSASTKATEYKIGIAFCLEHRGKEGEYREDFEIKDRTISKVVEFYGKPEKEYEFTKYIAVYTSRDSTAEPESEALKAAARAIKEGYDALYERNCENWLDKWSISDVRIEGDDISQQGIRYNIFQLIQVCDEDNPFVSIGARGLSHSRYKGCYFWDTDIFMLPFYLYTNPKAAKNLIMYRFNTLEGARENARVQNVNGARYAWMCTNSGIEQCDSWDIGLSEVHITADVAYALNQYVSITGAEDFIIDYGAEMLIETARYWGSRFTFNEESGKYNLLFVKGPDEYCGVSSNNTYTVFMAVHNLKLAKRAVAILRSRFPQKLQALKEKLHFDEKEIEVWEDISGKVVINYDSEKKLYIEDDTFLKLEPCDIKILKEGSMASYHRICFDRLQRYRVLKQADVLLLMQLLPELFSKEERMAAWEFYEPITLHDSSLSFGTHAQFAANLGLIDEAYDYFIKCVRNDIDDVMQNVGKEGLHMACMGSAYQALINGFGGVSIEEGNIKLNPILPHRWKALSFSLIYKGELFKVNISRKGEGLETNLECPNS